MPIRHAIWKVGQQPQPLIEAILPSERLLEDMILADPRILDENWMFIGRQEDTGYGGRIDLLAIAPDGVLILIELKRDRTPREVVAQAIDYASWVSKLKPENINAIYSRFTKGGNLAEDFHKRFNQELDEESLNESHQIIVVASAIDESSERIIAYLSERDIPINVVCFQVFNYGDDQLLSRAWLLDPAQTQISAATAPDNQSEPWNGEFYSSFGESEVRSWADAVQYGFICGGGGRWYSKTLQLLNPGDRVWVNIPGSGYVGVGRAIGRVQPAATFQVDTSQGKMPVLDVVKRASYHREYLDDPERCEYFVPIEWIQAVSLEKAIKEIGFFGNQNTVCKPTKPKWRATVERLKQKFPGYDKTIVASPKA